VIRRFKIGDVRFTFTIARTAKVIGVNSQLDDGRHILMWDFDEATLDEVVEALSRVQTRYALSEVYILQTKYPDHHIAYCFTALDWQRVAEVIVSTAYVDMNFFKYGVYRGHFTLRVTAKDGRVPQLVLTLPGWEPSNCGIDDLESWVRYETLRR